MRASGGERFCSPLQWGPTLARPHLDSRKAAHMFGAPGPYRPHGNDEVGPLTGYEDCGAPSVRGERSAWYSSVGLLRAMRDR